MNDLTDFNTFTNEVLKSIFGTVTPTDAQLVAKFGAPSGSYFTRVGTEWGDLSFFLCSKVDPEASMGERDFASATFYLRGKNAECVVEWRSVEYGDGVVCNPYRRPRVTKSAKQANCKDWGKLLDRALAL